MLAAGYILLVAAAATGTADAETGPKPVEIQFDGPEGCSGAEAFYGFLRWRTNHVRRAEADEPHTTLQVRLSRGRNQILGELRMVDDRGGTDTRKVQGASCDEVVQALSLTAALAFDPAALLTVPTEAPSADAGAAASAAKPPDVQSAVNQPTSSPLAPAETVAARTARRVPGFELAVGPVAQRVIAGGFSLGIAVAARNTFGKDGVLTPTFGLAIAYVRNDVLQSPPDAQIALASVGATACPLRLTARVLTVQPCALLLGGWLSATGRQLTHVSTVDRFWLSAGATLRVAVFLGLGFALELEGGVSALLLKRRFYATLPTNVVAETPTLSPLVGVGLTYGW